MRADNLDRAAAVLDKRDYEVEGELSGHAELDFERVSSGGEGQAEGLHSWRAFGAVAAELQPGEGDPVEETHLLHAVEGEILAEQRALERRNQHCGAFGEGA